jgi:hypothetical protein
MIQCARGVSIALAALLTSASACFSANAPAASAKADQAGSANAPGTASLGGGLGGSYFLADADYTQARDGGGTGRGIWGSRDAAARFAFAGNLRYVMSRHFRWQVSPGFLWSGYSGDGKVPFRTAVSPDDSLRKHLLTLMMPVSFQIQLLQHGKSWLWHEGLGPGIYRVWVEQNRRFVKDPVTERVHRGFYPGGSLEVGAEHFLRNLTAVSLEFSVESHFVFAQRNDQFPSGFNSNLWTVEARFGANYHFNPMQLRKPASKAAPK